MNSAPLSTRNAEQVDMLAARIDAIIRPSAPGNSSSRQAKPKAFSGSAERGASAPLRDHRRDDQADERPADRAHALDDVAVEHADAAGPLVPPGADGGEHVRLRHDPDQTVHRQHRDHPGPDPGRRRQREAERLERRLHAVEPADDAPAKRDEHERQHDDQEALEQIGPGRRDQPADEAVEMNITVIATTISLTPTPPPVAWLITLPAPFSMLPVLMMKKHSAKTM